MSGLTFKVTVNDLVSACCTKLPDQVMGMILTETKQLILERKPQTPNQYLVILKNQNSKWKSFVRKMPPNSGFKDTDFIESVCKVSGHLKVIWDKATPAERQS